MAVEAFSRSVCSFLNTFTENLKKDNNLYDNEVKEIDATRSLRKFTIKSIRMEVMWRRQRLYIILSSGEKRCAYRTTKQLAAKSTSPDISNRRRLKRNSIL